MITKRFKEIVSTQIIHDNTTGRDWHGLMEDGFIELINELIKLPRLVEAVDL